MLLVLDSPRELSMEQLLSEVAMPLREIGKQKMHCAGKDGLPRLVAITA